MCLLTSTSLCLDKIPALEYNNIVSGNVGMADEQDSDSCVGYHVWVQVPFSALINIFKGVIRLIPITPFLHFIQLLPKSITPVITIHCYFYNPILFLINNCYLSYNRLVILSNRTIVICCLNIGTYLIYNIHTICYITKTGIITIKVCTVFMNYKEL